MPWQVQVGNGLTHGKRGLVQVQFAFEHDGQDVGTTAGLFRAGFHDLRKPVAVMVL